MTVVMTHIINIGNSRGIRTPKVLLDQVGLKDEVALIVEQEQLIVRPVRGARRDWDEQFRLMAQRGDDRSLDGEVSGLTRWDEEAWEWS